MSSRNPNIDPFVRQNAASSCRLRLQFLSCFILLLSGIFYADGTPGHPEDSERHSLKNGGTTALREEREKNSVTNDKTEVLSEGSHVARDGMGNNSPQDSNIPSVEEIMESGIGGESTVGVYGVREEEEEEGGGEDAVEDSGLVGDGKDVSVETETILTSQTDQLSHPNDNFDDDYVEAEESVFTGDNLGEEVSAETEKTPNQRLIQLMERLFARKSVRDIKNAVDGLLLLAKELGPPHIVSKYWQAPDFPSDEDGIINDSISTTNESNSSNSNGKDVMEQAIDEKDIPVKYIYGNTLETLAYYGQGAGAPSAEMEYSGAYRDSDSKTLTEDESSSKTLVEDDSSGRLVGGGISETVLQTDNSVGNSLSELQPKVSKSMGGLSISENGEIGGFIENPEVVSFEKIPADEFHGDGKALTSEPVLWDDSESRTSQDMSHEGFYEKNEGGAKELSYVPLEMEAKEGQINDIIDKEFSDEEAFMSEEAPDFMSVGLSEQPNLQEKQGEDEVSDDGNVDEGYMSEGEEELKTKETSQEKSGWSYGSNAWNRSESSKDNPLKVELENAASNAIFLLSVLSSSGIAPDVYPRNDTRAIEELFKAADSASLQAILVLGMRHLQGRGLKKSCRTAAWYLQTVADRLFSSAEQTGDFQMPKPSIRLRERLRDGSYMADILAEDAVEQVELDEDQAMRGVPLYQRHLGYRRLLGRGMERDPEGAFRHFEDAAANGDDVAAFNLGYMHMKGISTPINYTKAEQLFRKAAVKNLSAALNGLGVLHFNGWGTPINFTQARFYFLLAGARNDSDSLFNLGIIYYQGYDVPRNLTRAIMFFERASNAGHWRSPHTLAILYSDVNSPIYNCSKAVKLFRIFISERGMWPVELEQAALAYDDKDYWSALFRFSVMAEEGSVVGMENAAYMLRKGEGYTGNNRYDMALELLLRASQMGSHHSLVDAGDLHYHNKVSNKSEEAMASYYAISGAAGEPEGLFSLAMLYQFGIHFPQNFTKARELLRESLAFSVDNEMVPIFLAIWFLEFHSFLFKICIFTSRIWDRVLESIPTLNNSVKLASRQDFFLTVLQGWDSLLVVILTVVLSIVFQMRLARKRRAVQEARREESNSVGAPSLSSRLDDNVNELSTGARREGREEREREGWEREEQERVREEREQEREEREEEREEEEEWEEVLEEQSTSSDEEGRRESTGSQAEESHSNKAGRRRGFCHTS